jgi:hypothetical protein
MHSNSGIPLRFLLPVLNMLIAVALLAGLLGGIGEGSTILWLLIMGAKDLQLPEPSK